MTLAERLAEYVRACFSGIWIESCEHEDALTEIARLCHEESWRLATWGIDRGLRMQGNAEQSVDAAGDPLAAIRSLSALAMPDGAALVVLCNFHRFLGSVEIVQALATQITAGKQNRTFVVVLSPVVDVPVELQKQFVVLEHELPDLEQLGEIARGIATEEDELPGEDEFERVLDAAAGLTRYEAEGAFSLAIVRHGRLEASTLWELKTQTLKKSGLVELYRGGESFSDLGGLESLKNFCTRIMRRPHESARCRPRGVLLLSPPGCGKSSFAKAPSNDTGRPTLRRDVGAL